MSDRTVGDYGQALAIQVGGIDATLTDTHAIVVRKPDGTKVTWAPATVTAGLLTYLFAPGDLDQAGVYSVELVLTWGLLVDPPGQATSSIVTFLVVPQI